MLQNLQKKNPDSAITAALQKLELDEKARQKKADLQFRTLSDLAYTSPLLFEALITDLSVFSTGGIFAAKSKAFAAKKSEEGGGGAQITEIVEDDAAETSKAEASTLGGKKKQTEPESPAGTSTS